MRTYTALLLVLTLLCPAALLGGTPKKNFTAQGQVLEVVSASEFEMDDYKVVVGSGTTLTTVRPDHARETAPLKPDSIHVGALLTVTGSYDSSTETIRASEIEITPPSNDSKVHGVALIERAPSLSKTGAQWTGTIFADGRRLIVAQGTEVSFAKQTPAEIGKEHPLTSIDQVGLNVWAAYEGTPAPDGTVKLAKIGFSRNVLSEKEAKYLKEYAAKTIPLKNDKLSTNTFQIRGFKKKLESIPDATIQEKISAIGNTLVPDAQRRLPDSDPNKIHFRFYVVKGLKFWTMGTPDGSIFVSSELFGRLSNEAQLAGVMAQEIAGVTQHSGYRLSGYANWNRTLCWASLGAGWLPFPAGLVMSAAHWTSVAEGVQYEHSLQTQAGRLGVEYAVAAGYDPREIRAAYKLLATKDPAAPKHTGYERSAFRTMTSEATNVLGTAYRDADFSKLQTKEEAFKQLAASVKEAASK